MAKATYEDSDHDDPRDAIRAVRDWLSSHGTGVLIPGGKVIFERYERFRAQLPAQARDAKLDHHELTFGDYTGLVVGWLTKIRGDDRLAAGGPAGRLPALRGARTNHAPWTWRAEGLGQPAHRPVAGGGGVSESNQPFDASAPKQRF
jgi:hypothetical protein